MIEECEPPDPLTVQQIEEWADEASYELKNLTGATLPRLRDSPPRARNSVRCLQLNIEIPQGSLFYPCCGTDESDAIRLFRDCISTFHFADPYRSQSSAPQPRGAWRSIEVPHIVTVASGTPARRELQDSGCTIYRHRKDGLLTFIEDVGDLAIFYYRGDSYGEGGSNQRWLEPVLFHSVLGKLLNGGLIVTGGSNCGYWDEDYELYAPWNAICGGELFVPPQSRDSFEYAGRNFSCVGKLATDRGQKLAAWQVSGADEI